MAEAIVIKISLDAGDLSQSKGEIRKAIRSALDSVIPDAREIGRKMGDALAAGIGEGLAKAKQIRSQLDQALNPAQRHSTAEAAEAKHQQRLIELERRKQAQIDVIRARSEADAEKSARRVAEAQEKAFNRSKPPDSLLGFFKRYSSTLREAGESIQQAGFGIAALTGGIFELGRRAVQGTIDIDKQVNTLKALTGSAEAAEKRYAALIAVAAKTPGLTTSLAAILDAQLRTSSVTVQTIDKILPAIGKLNAVSNIADPQKFTQNLIQLFTQNFERQDLKELVGQSPLAAEIIKQIFNVDSPTNAKAIRESAKKLGITSLEAFVTLFAEGVAKNAKLAGVTESIGTQFEKLRDRVLVALRPLGLAIIDELKPLVDKAIPIIERLSKAFADLSPGAKQAILIFAGIVAAIGPLLIAVGILIQSFGAFGDLIKVIAGTGGAGGLAAAGEALLAILPIIAAVAAAAALLFAAWQTNFGGIRELTADVVKELTGIFGELRSAWAEIWPDLRSTSLPVLDELRNAFQFWSETVGAVWRGIWDVVKTVVREAVDVIKPTIAGFLALTQGDFRGFSENALKIWRETWDAILAIPSRIFISLIDIVEKGLTSLLTTTGFAKNVGLKIGDSLGQGIIDGFTSAASSPTTSLAIRGLIETVRGTFAGRDVARQNQRKLSAEERIALAGRGLDGEEITPTDLANSNIARLKAEAEARAAAEEKRRLNALLGGGTSTEESLLKRLTKQAAEAELAIKQLQDTGSKEFKLRLEIEDKQAFKSDLEEIIKLRRNLSLPLDSPLPRDKAEAKTTIENLKAIVENLEAFKKLGEFTRDLDPLATFKSIQSSNLIAQTEKFNELQTELLIKSDGVKKATEEEALAKQLLTDKYSGLSAAQKELLLGQAKEIDNQDALKKAEADRQKALASDFRLKDLALQKQEVAIQNAINAGVLTEAQGKEQTLALQRQYRDVLINSLELQKQAGLNPEQIAQINVQIEQLKGLGAELTPLGALFKGFRSQAETLAESFERIGSAFKDKVLGVVDSGIDRLTNKLGFFKSLVGDILKSLTRFLIGGLLQPSGGGAAGGGGGGGSFISNILGGLLGGRNQSSGSGGIGSLLTGGFSGGGGAAAVLNNAARGGVPLFGNQPIAANSALGKIGLDKIFGGNSGAGLLPALSSAIEGGVTAPASVSLGGLGDIRRLIGVSGRNPGGVPIFTQDTLTGGGKIGSNLFGNLFQGIGFGKAPGSGGALAGALPLLGLSLGSSLGTDRLTSILGGIAGGVLGVGLSAAPAIIGAGGALSGLGFLAPLFSNPITAVVAGLALPAIFLLGRARQRKRDEKSSGDSLQQAVDAIKDLRKQVENNEITLNVTQARKLFDDQILQPFIQQISQLKSKSVRESRLKNQTADLKALFEKEVIPAVQAQKTRQGINDKIIPEFAFGGVVPGFPTPGIDSVVARLSPGEMVLTTNHQAMLQAVAGRDIFQSIGVPDSGQAVGDGSTAFARGGFVARASQVGSSPPVINMTVQLVVTPGEATNILNAAASTDDGQVILVNARKSATRSRLTR